MKSRVFWLRSVLALATLMFVGAQALAQNLPDPPLPAVKRKEKVKPSPHIVPPVHSVRALKAYIERIEKGAKEKAKTKDKNLSLVAHEEKETLGLDYLESLLFDLELRAYPNDAVDWSAYYRAIEHRDQMEPQFLPAAGERWEYAGPRNLPVPYRIYYGQGSIIGRVNAVAYHPAQEGVYFLGGAEGGIWKSSDFGQTWTPLSDNWSALHVSSIAIHPTNPNVIYVGTGDFHGSRGYPFGIMKSTDGGLTWTNLGRTEFAGLCVSKVLLDPENPEIVTLTNGRGPTYWGNLWRSTDGGNHWTQVITTQAAWNDVIYGARNPNTGVRYYYATGHSDNGGQVWRSSDRGLTWTRLNTPLTNSNNVFQDAIEVATSPTNPDTVYLISGYERRVWKSTNAGNSWTDITGNFPNGNNNYNWSQAWYDIHMLVSTRTVSGNPVDVVYVGLIDLVQSNDGGSTWQAIGRTYTSGALTHNDQHCMAINPRNPNEALVGNDGGIFRLTYDPTSNTWVFDTSLNRNLGITQFYHADFHPTSPSRLLGGTQDNATPMARGDLNNWGNVGGGDGGFCAINRLNPSIQYASSQYLNIYRTTNEWFNSGTITPSYGSDRRAFIAPLTLDPSQPNRLYAGTNYLWLWNETTQSWTPRLGNQLLSVNGVVISIAVAPSDSNRIYTGSSQGELWMTMNGGNTWLQINTGNPSLPTRSITSIAVHPTNPNKIYVTVGGSGTPHLWRCDNTTAPTRVWINTSGSGINGLPDIHTATVALDPTNPDTTLYVGTDVGVFYSTNGGATWRNGTVPYGLPNVRVNTLKAIPGTGYLNAATYGRGIWRIQLPFANLPGDVDGDGCVNNADLRAVLLAFGNAGSNLPEDLNRNGRVEDGDVEIVLAHFGNGC